MFVAISISLWDIFGDMGVCFLGLAIIKIISMSYFKSTCQINAFRSGCIAYTCIFNILFPYLS